MGVNHDKSSVDLTSNSRQVQSIADGSSPAQGSVWSGIWMIVLADFNSFSTLFVGLGAGSGRGRTIPGTGAVLRVAAALAAQDIIGIAGSGLVIGCGVGVGS